MTYGQVITFELKEAIVHIHNRNNSQTEYDEKETKERNKKTSVEGNRETNNKFEQNRKKNKTKKRTMYMRVSVYWNKRYGEQQRAERVRTNLQQKHGSAKRIVKGTERNWLFPFVFRICVLSFFIPIFVFFFIISIKIIGGGRRRL